jgi:enoyl-CoA hydratase/carnithine racemase
MERVVTYVSDGSIGRLEMCRPPVNAISMSLYEGIIEGFKAATEDGCRVLLFGSSLPGMFCAGADLKEWQRYIEDADYNERREELFFELVRSFRRFPYPVIGVLDGAAIGGGYNFLSFCDFRVASRSSWCSIPEIDAGRVGGARNVMKYAPVGFAKLMAFTGMRMAAERMYQAGAIEVLCAEDETPWDVATGIASTISRKNPEALRLTRKTLNAIEDQPYEIGAYVSRQAATQMATSREGRGLVDTWLSGRGGPDSGGRGNISD